MKGNLFVYEIDNIKNIESFCVFMNEDKLCISNNNCNSLSFLNNTYNIFLKNDNELLIVNTVINNNCELNNNIIYREKINTIVRRLDDIKFLKDNINKNIIEIQKIELEEKYIIDLETENSMLSSLIRSHNKELSVEKNKGYKYNYETTEIKIHSEFILQSGLCKQLNNTVFMLITDIIPVTETKISTEVYQSICDISTNNIIINDPNLTIYGRRIRKRVDLQSYMEKIKK